MLKTKSVHSPVNKADGLRILASRLRGRGLPKNRYHVWMANLGPSEKLLRGFQSGRITWEDFKRRYQAELLSSDDIDADNRTIKNHGQKFTLRLLQSLAMRQTLTLMCHCAEDELHCHRHILHSILLKKI
jgi:uncharacterized protein YeaO (DUF488 family)